MKKIFSAIATILAVASCSGDGFLGDYEYAKDGGYMAAYGDYEGGVAGVGEGGEGEGNQQTGQAGVITAAEWNDLLNWSFWGGLMTGDYSKFNTYWGMNTAKRIAIEMVDPSGAPYICQPISLVHDGKVLWEAMTDNKGEANLWLAVEDVQSTVVAADCKVMTNDAEATGEPLKVYDWTSTEPIVNKLTSANAAPAPKSMAQIAFIVDATGSMMDEIDFLKKDLLDILNKAGQINDIKLYTGTVFYRDTDDAYLTRTSPFTDKVSETIDFISKQTADGGGDLPEAVHTALEVTLKDLQWTSDAYASMVFMLLDAPAHVDHNGVIESLQKSIRGFAAKGIKLIPVFCSSGDKTCEFMCRQMAILTGGTYVFLTSDSGIGGEHVEASVGEYQVEHLNSLILRLITKYIQ